MSIGFVLFKLWMIIGCIWAVYVASAFVGYQGTNYNNVINLPPMWMLAYPTFPLILGTFIICQFPIHQKMVEYKRQEILRLDNMLDELNFHNAEDLDEELRNKIDFLYKQKEQFRQLPEWPFSLVSLLGTGASSVTAVFPVLFVEIFPDLVSNLFNTA